MEKKEGFKYFPFLFAKQPIGNMYVCVLDADFLQTISTTDIHRKVGECRDVEEYVGIQRPLNPTREREIGKYVTTTDATFPNSIILSIKSEFVHIAKDSIETNGETINREELGIKEEEGIASVLDGQHRIAGLKYLDLGKIFQCIVTIFVDIDMEDQATIFSTINREQKKVSPSLVSDLYDFYKTRNPQRTCHNIARVLNSMEKSPLEGKISIIGSADNKKGESITQALFVNELLRHISRDPLLDRDILKRKDFWGNRGKLSCTDKDIRTTCLRKLFIEDEKDIKITQVMFNFFKAVDMRWPSAWSQVRDNNILNKSTGFIALMRFFGNLYRKIDKDVPTSSEFYTILKKCNIDDNSFTKDEYDLGTGGQNQLKSKLLESLND